jgi:hypothetical protein
MSKKDDFIKSVKKGATDTPSIPIHKKDDF